MAEEAQPKEEEEEIPKLPRARLRGRPSLNAVVRLGMFATVLYAIIVMRKPCGEGVARVIFPSTDATDAGPPSLSEQYPGFELMTAEEALKRWPDSPAHDGGTHDAKEPASQDAAQPATRDAAN